MVRLAALEDTVTRDKPGVAMAVQQRRKSKSRRDMRRAHDALAAPTLSIEPTSGETHRRHHVSADGFYRGRKVVPAKDE